LLPEERQLLMEAVGVEHETIRDEELDGIRALGAGAPAMGAPSGTFLDHGDGLLHHLIFLAARQITGDIGLVAVAFQEMARVENGLDRLREGLGNGTAGQKGGLDVFFLENSQQSINGVVGTVLALTPHLVVQNAVLVRLHVLAALEIKGEKNGCPLAARPADEMVVVVFLEHGVCLSNPVATTYSGNRNTLAI